MDVSAAHERIRQRIADGVLPRAKPTKTWVGPGKGRSCDGCGGPMSAPQLEYEHDFEDGSIVRFHGVCDALWKIENAH